MTPGDVLSRVEAVNLGLAAFAATRECRWSRWTGVRPPAATRECVP